VTPEQLLLHLIFGRVTDHAFQPYAEFPDMCVAELYDGDTCNRPAEDHEILGEEKWTQ
jgi:hypothetical protein